VIATWWGLALLTIALSALAMGLTAYAAHRAGRVSVVDVTWGVALAAIAVAGAVVGAGTPWRRWLIAVLVVAWGVRLSRHVFKRARGHGEDPRYAELLGGGGVATAVRKVYVVQGLAICLVSLPVMAAAHWDLAAAWLVWVGVVVWVVGVVFEAVGDAQLAAYKRDPDRGPVMDRGLWGWTRHPNYFGDACVWWGIWLVGGAASGWWPAVVTLAAPLAMTHFLRNVTGAKLLERTMSKRPGWDEYAARVPFFVPHPPLGRTPARRGSP
jgi:steroid 5-alpha reductase family enzyme